MFKKGLSIAFVVIAAICLWGTKITAKEKKVLAYGTAGIQVFEKKVGGGEIDFEGIGSPGPVTFSHKFHVTKQKKKCTSCHMKLFKMKKGASQITMQDMYGGKACGKCHNGKVAFKVITSCEKCHKT
ncbi:MAG: cytochrome c3 family protein [Nitrospinota bacterium]